jgi:hypothetical protein
MNDRTAARLTGVLFILATAGSLAGTALSKPALGDAVDPARIVANQSPLVFGMLLRLLGDIACPAIALAMYPVLRRYGETPALGSVLFRGIEATFYLLGAVCVLLIAFLAREAAVAGPGSTSFAQTSALLLAAADLLGFVVAVLFFGLGALLYYAVLFRARLVPRWLAGGGVVGAVMTMTSAVLVLMGTTTPMATPHLLLNLPIFVQEMVLAVWLLTKGFTSRTVAAESTVAGSMAGAGAAA